jgi:soluble lytic murein transglycosylase-like protein
MRILRTLTVRGGWGWVALSAVAIGAVGSFARGIAADPPGGTAERALRHDLEAARGALSVAQLQLARADAILGYSTTYRIPADLTVAIHDIAVAEGIEPSLAFSLVQVESHFDSLARSPAGAIGYTQVLLSTARLYEPGITERQLYDRDTNLRLGFRYLRDLLERYPAGDPGLALLAYNRGPARVDKLLDAGLDPQNGYATTVLKRYPRRR